MNYSIDRDGPGECDEDDVKDIPEFDAATRIGKLISEALKLAPDAGLILEINIKPAKREDKSDLKLTGQKIDPRRKPV